MNQSRSSKPFYGYYIVAACFINLFMLWGLFVNSFGIFMVPITQEMGWSREALSTTLSVRSLGMALMAPVAGRLIDRLGAKPVMAVGALVVGIGLIAAGRVNALWQVHVIFFIAGCGLICATMIPTSLILSNWFVTRRGTAMSLAFVGTGAGGAVMAPVASWIIRTYSWRTAFTLCGGLIALMVVPIVLLIIRNRPSDMGLEPYTGADAPAETSAKTSAETSAKAAGEEWGVDAREAFSRREFWLIAAVMFIVALIANGIHNHCPAYLEDIGHSPERAAFAWSVVMGVLVLGKLAFGPIADRWGAGKTMAATFAIYTVSILVLMMAKPYWLAMVFAGLYGFACGAPLTLYPLLVVGTLGMRNFGSIYGNLLIAGAIGSAIGPYAPGLVVTRTGSYLPIFAAFMIFAALGVVCALFIKPAQSDLVPDPKI